MISPADIDTAKQQVKKVWSKIQARDFYTVCGKGYCNWCNFVNDHQLATELYDLETYIMA